MFPHGQKSLSRVLTSSANGFRGLAELKLVFGVIMEVDPVAFTASVRTTQGVFDNVKIPIVNYTPGAGIFAQPSPKDYCVLGTAENGQHFIVAFYSGFSAGELDTKERETVEPTELLIKSPKKVQIKVETSTECGIIDMVAAEDGTVSVEASVGPSGETIPTTKFKLSTASGVQVYDEEAGRYSAVLSAAMLAKMFTDAEVAPSDGGLILKTKMAIALNLKDPPSI